MTKKMLWVVLLLAAVGISNVLAQESAADYPASVFARLEAFTGAKLSPNGERLAFLYPLEGRQHLVVRNLDAKTNSVVPPIEGLSFNWMQWANNETLVFSMSLSAKRRGYALTETEETRLIALNVITKEITPLIRPAEVVGRTGSRVAKEYYGEPQIQDKVVDWLPDEPDHILVAVDEDFDNRYEVRKIDVNSGRYRTHRKSIEGIQNWIADQSGDIRLGYGFSYGKQRMLFKTGSGDWLTLTETPWYENGWKPLSFTSEPDVIIVTGTGEHGTREARTLDTTTGEFVETLYSNPEYDVSGVLKRSRSRERIGVLYTDHVPRVDYFEESFAQLQAEIDERLPATNNRIQSYSDDLQMIVIKSFDSREPGLIRLWDRDSDELTSFGRFNDKLDSALLADVNPVTYAGSDGTTIPAYLTLPIDSAAESLPAIILPHGGPEARDDKSYWFLTQFLVSRGYAVLQPNFRGSSGYGEAFRLAGRGQWGGVMQDDVDAGARWLVAEGIADPDRMCIVGWSYGGYSAAIGLVKAPELYQCGVGINGVYNLPQHIADANEYVGGTAWTRHIGLDGESTRSVSPYHQANRYEAPFLIIHAEDDHRVRVSQADKFYEALVKDDKDVRLVKVEHGGHSMVTAAAREKILQSVDAFLQENIGAP